MITFTRKLITPAIAEEYLKLNISNRRLKVPSIARYANDMANGRWNSETGETIKFSRSNVLIDGQNRLRAVIKANSPIYFYVATNVDDAAFAVLDTGSVRNATDVFKIEQIKNDNTIPSIISFYNLLRDGRMSQTHKQNKATNAILLNQYYEDEVFWQNIAKRSHSWYLDFAKIIPPSNIGGFFAYFCKISEEKAIDFMSQLATGSGIKNNSISLLRSRLMQDKMSPRKMTPTTRMALIIKTWNAFVNDHEIKTLKFDTIRDEFPVVASKLKAS